MIRSRAECTWESLDGSSTIAHIYGLFPGAHLSRSVLGVRRDAPVADKVIVIEPHLGDLTLAEGTVVTELGLVSVSWKSVGDNVEFNITVPAGVNARLRLPAVAGSPTNQLNGKPILGAPQAGRLESTLKPGRYEGRYASGQAIARRISEERCTAASTLGTEDSNMALRGTATQSSVGYGGAIAARAIDGNTDGRFSNNSVTHTGSDKNAWWQVDLGANCIIKKIKCFNRTDADSGRAANYDVKIGTGGSTWMTVLHQTEIMGTPTVVTTGSVTGRYVRIQLRSAEILTLAEVEVWGHPVRVAAAGDSAASAATIKKIFARVADWQIANPPSDGNGGSEHKPDRWTMGALYAGMYPWSQVAGDEKYLNYLKAQCEINQWKLGPAKHNFADDQCVGALYLALYAKDKDPRMIAALKAQFDVILSKQPAKARAAGAPWRGPWSWCDALFMAPPVWAGLSAATGDRKYIDYMDKEWWSTEGYLYDKDEHLYFRDSSFFSKKEANGKKIFWGRGNGWVLAGLARVLQVMPKDYPTREKYEKLFQEMAAKIASLQQDDGLWRASLLDPAHYPVKETSASGFFCFGLAWGINQGLLDKQTYRPKVLKAWNALVGCVHPEGKLGNVQPIGADPQKVTDNMTEVYGVGAFLLAGTEILKLEQGAWK
jgi:rhamnogalacturonyl hydrolase YesR